MTLPKENLDNKPFSDLLKEAISRIPVYAPEWTDHNVHDPGITLLELFSWLTEMQIYRINRISDKSYRKFLKLMGIPELKSANAAKVNVTFSLLPCVAQPDMPVSVPKWTIVAATDVATSEDILFTTEQALTIINTEIRILSCAVKADKDFPAIDMYIDNSEANKNDNVYYYAFGTEKPKKDDGLYIGFKEDPGKEIVLSVNLLDDELFKKEDDSVLVPAGKLVWEYYGTEKSNGIKNDWRKIEEAGIIEDKTKHFTISGTIRISLVPGIKTPEMKKKDIGKVKDFYWVRCRVDEAGYEIPPKIDCILLNTVPAVHAIQYENYKFSSTGLPNFHVDLKFAPLMDKRLLGKEIQDKIDETKSKIDLSVYSSAGNSYRKWKEVEDFDASKPESEHYTVDLASGRVSFGNGINGKIPPKGTNNIEISYFSGGGTRGNVNTGAVTRIISNDRSKDILGKVTVTNYRVASGGTDAESLEEAKQRVKNELKEVTRAVTSADYEQLALKTPGVQVARAKALPRYHPSQNREVPGIVSVVVVPKSSPNVPNLIPNQDFLRAVYRHLEEYRLLATELFVLAPEYVNISVEATVIVKPKSLRDKVKTDVEEKLKEFFDPVSGGFDRKGWPFGRHVYVSEICEVIDGVEGVDYIIPNSVILKKDGDVQKFKIDVPLKDLVYLDLEKTKITATEET